MPQPTKMSESQAMGTGSYKDTFPTENTFRNDLNLTPPRATHQKASPSDFNPSDVPPPANFRPGG
jgi:hypothetical protein